MTSIDRAFLSGYSVAATASAGMWVRGLIEHWHTMTPDDVVGATVSAALIGWCVFRCCGDGFDVDRARPLRAVGLDAAVRP